MSPIEMRSRRNPLYPRLLSGPALIILMTCCFFDETAASKNPKYEACKREVCGNVSIKYPFWIKSDFCGLGGFQMECNNSGQPLMDLIFGHYRVQRNESIHYEKEFMELKAMPDFNVSCLPEFHYPDTFPPPPSTDPDLTAQVHFFYHCNNTLPFPPLTCSSNGINQSYIALVPWSDQQKLWPISEKSLCKSHFYTEVELKRSDFDKKRKTIHYQKFFNDNFTLNYWASHWTGEQCRACQISGGECGQSEEEELQIQCFCSDHNDPEICTKGKTYKHLKIGLGAGIGTLAIAVILLTMFLIRYRRMHASLKALSINNSSAGNSLMSELAGSHVYFEVPSFENKELEEATNNFDPLQELGHGGFGTVYYGKLRDGREVAVKRLYEHNNRLVKQFMTEVRILARLQHKNLVSLYGCTSRLSHKLLLVYEYVSNGTLADHLHGDRSEHGLLPWHIRMNIAIEAATALVYLHASDIIHRDVKTNNILLDNNFSVKVGDFGLSRLFPNNITHISTAPQGTPGYMDPEYHQCYQLTEKSDVYSFGVVLVELVSSLPAVDITRDRHEINLANLAINRIQKRAFHELIDPSLGFDSDAGIREKITGVAELAFICLQQEKEMRPSMFTVLEELKAIASETEVVGRSRTFPPCLECDKVALLKNMIHSSPISVAQKWISSNSSCSPSISA